MDFCLLKLKLGYLTVGSSQVKLLASPFLWAHEFHMAIVTTLHCCLPEIAAEY